MTLGGEAKRSYQREYMRRRRLEAKEKEKAAKSEAVALTSVIFFQLAENLVPEGLNGVVVAGLGRVSSELAVQEPPSEPQRRAKVR